MRQWNARRQFNSLAIFLKRRMLYWLPAVHVQACHRLQVETTKLKEHAMSKIQKGNKESRKEPLLNPKEKKAAKLARKTATVSVPFIPKHTH